jgi:hypothetical protein
MNTTMQHETQSQDEKKTARFTHRGSGGGAADASAFEFIANMSATAVSDVAHDDRSVEEISDVRRTLEGPRSVNVMDVLRSSWQGEL